MKIAPLRRDLLKVIEKYGLKKKWNKAVMLFEEDFRHPSLHTELLEPHQHGIYSFRVDRKYRALFFITKKGMAEVFAITAHYKR